MFRNQKGLAWTVLLCIAISIGGCAAVPVQSLPGKPYPQSTRTQYLWFSILPPQGKGWVAQEGCAGTGSVGFSTTSSKQGAGAGAPHTVVALLRAGRDTNVPRHDRAALLKYLIDAQRKDVSQGERFKLIAYDASEDKSAGQRCIKWSFTVEDRGVPGLAGEVFKLGGWGVSCVHPEVASLMVILGYTQRFRQGGQWMTEFDTEAESFLKSLRFTSFYDSDDPSPLVIQSLEDYAILLKEKSREEEAKKIEQYAKIMLQSIQTAESSFLGFVPDKVLREYSALLLQEGRNKKAKKMNSLADAWHRANEKAATRRIEEYKKKKIQSQE